MASESDESEASVDLDALLGDIDNAMEGKGKVSDVHSYFKAPKKRETTTSGGGGAGKSGTRESSWGPTPRRRAELKGGAEDRKKDKKKKRKKKGKAEGKKKRAPSGSDEDIDALLGNISDSGDEVAARPAPQQLPSPSSGAGAGGDAIIDVERRVAARMRRVGCTTIRLQPVGSLKRQCPSLRCIKCDFKVLVVRDYRWNADVDYFFFRNNTPETAKLLRRASKQRGTTAQCCQCSWRSVSEPVNITDDDPELRWVCARDHD